MKQQHGLAFWTATLAVVLLGSVPAMGQGLEDLVDACEVTAPDLLPLLENEAMIVGPDYIHYDSGSNTWSIDTWIYTWSTWIPAGATLCTDSRFYGQTAELGFPFRSAVQVGPDLLLTAWHEPFPNSALPVYAVFGMRYDSSCNPPDWSNIPDANVFEVTAIVADGFNDTPPRDFLLLELEAVVSHTFPRVRRSGQGRGENLPYPDPNPTPYRGDRLTQMSHPERLATKVDLSGRLYDYFQDGPRVKYLHPLPGSSGGMVFNRDERFVETVFQSGGGASYAFDPADNCYLLVANSNAHGTNAKMAVFAHHIPAWELLVEPLDTIVHTCVAGLCNNLSTTRIVKAPNPGQGAIDYAITQVISAGPPHLILSAPSFQGTLQPGDQISVQETIDITGAACPKVYERTYRVTDETHGFTDVIRHIFDIQC